MKKYGFFLWSLFCLLLLPGISVRAESPARVTFTNTQPEETGLYITKKVSAPSGTEIPRDDSFSFRLTLGGVPAGEHEYRLFHCGKEVFNYNGNLTTEKNEHQIPDPFLTDRNGFFTLKAEDSAFFGELRAGISYEIYEEPAPGYLQAEPPENVSAAGILLKEGASVLFHNRYQPKPAPGGDTAALEIRKQLLFPAGYDPPEAPEFLFRLRMDGKPWSGEYFSLTDIRSGELLSIGKTAQDGSFCIKGGCLARFEQVPADVDYEILEEEKEGWRCLSKPKLRGTVAAPLTSLSFTNTEVSFAVAKKIENSLAKDTLFPFVLETKDGPWENAPYYLYRAGVLLDSEIRHTGTDGKFCLTAGQTAIFTGGEPGTVFHVKELPVSDYVQILPESAEGYHNKVIGSSAEILPFVNAYEPDKKRSLCIQKVNESEEPLAGAVLELYADCELTELLEQTSSDKAGKAAFRELEPGVYYIKEAVSPAGYRLMVNPIRVDITEDWYSVNGGAVHPLSSRETEIPITVYNYRDFRLPLTGSSGSALYFIAGMIGILAAVLFLKKKKP